MGYADGNYNGDIYIGAVKWNNDYKHVMDFGNATNRDNFLKSHLTKQSGHIGIIPTPNGYIDIDGIVENIENKNYLYYCNSNDISNTFYCCFITNYQILAQKNTRVFIQLDIFQQYFYDSNYYKCILERAHISKNEDNTNWKNYTAPEPVGATSEIDRNVDIFSNISFAPVLTFDALSKVESSQTGGGVIYEYGGNGSTPANSTGYYRFRPASDENYIFQALLAFWSEGETSTTTINHLSDLIGFNFMPQWLVTASTWSNYYDIGIQLDNNEEKTKSSTVSLNTTSLACGYQPTNKKMFTDLCRGYKLWTKNGVSVAIAPNQLADQTSLTLIVHQRPMGSTFKVEIENYKDINKRYFDLQYSYSIAFGINNNVGTAQQTALAQLDNQNAVLKASQKETAVNQTIGVVSNAIGAVGGAAGGILSGNYYEAAMSVAKGIGTGISQAYAMDRIGAEMDRDNFNMQLARNDAVSSITGSIGNNSDRSTMSDDFCKLRLAETSPTNENCRIIDDFLTVYGYAIQEIKNPSSFFRTRPLFNYIKTNNCNLQVNAPSDFENILKSIFNNGVTLWHYDYIYTDGQGVSHSNYGYKKFGDYDLKNFYSN